MVPSADVGHIHWAFEAVYMKEVHKGATLQSVNVELWRCCFYHMVLMSN